MKRSFNKAASVSRGRNYSDPEIANHNAHAGPSWSSPHGQEPQPKKKPLGCWQKMRQREKERQEAKRERKRERNRRYRQRKAQRLREQREEARERERERREEEARELERKRREEEEQRERLEKERQEKEQKEREERERQLKKERMERLEKEKRELEYMKIHKFLLFNFILANDTHAMSTILHQNCDTDMRLTSEDIDNYLNDDPFQSILGVHRYRALFQSCLKDMLDHRLRLARHRCYKFLNKSDLAAISRRFYELKYCNRLCKHYMEASYKEQSFCPAELYAVGNMLYRGIYLQPFIDNYPNYPDKYLSDTSFNLTLLELACVLCKTYKSTAMVELILSVIKVDENDLHVIVCNPSVNNEAIAQLLKSKPCHDGSELHDALSSSIIAYFDACQNDPKDPLGHSDTDTTLSKIKTLFQGAGKAIHIKNSYLFRICMQNAKRQNARPLVELALENEAWYILYLLLTNHHSEIEGISNLVRWIPRKDQPLFITNFLMRTTMGLYQEALKRNDQKAVEQTEFIIFNTKISNYFPLTQWLIYSYRIRADRNAMRRYGLCELLLTGNAQLHKSTFNTMCKILIKLGVDINKVFYIEKRDSNGFSTYTPQTSMRCAIQTDNMRLVRLLLYHNYDLTHKGDSSMNDAFDWERYSLLKVLLLCGGKLSQSAIELLTKDYMTPCIWLNVHEDRSWFKEWLEQPPSLSFHCRKSLREHYKTKLPQLLRSLDDRFPEKLKKYLRTEIL